MSIYASTLILGDPDWEDEEPLGVVLVREGGTNHYPSLDKNQRGSIDGALIPAWCVEGHRDDFDDTSIGGWYRLSFDTPNAHGQLLLDVDAVTALRDDLNRWLDYDKVSPQ
jgi:hypothetical protein